jgi:hypothetical protein
MGAVQRCLLAVAVLQGPLLRAHQQQLQGPLPWLVLQQLLLRAVPGLPWLRAVPGLPWLRAVLKQPAAVPYPLQACVWLMQQHVQQWQLQQDQAMLRALLVQPLWRAPAGGLPPLGADQAGSSQNLGGHGGPAYCLRR